MSNFYNELDELFSSSNQEDQNKETTNSTIISSPTSLELEIIQDELFDQMIYEKEVEQEESIILKERQIECMEHLLIPEQNLLDESGNSLTASKLTKNDAQVDIENDEFGSKEVVSSENVNEKSSEGLNVLTPRQLRFSEGVDFPMDKHIFIDSCLQRDEELKSHKLKIKEEKKSKYYVVPIGPKPDFSAHGDFAEILELDYAEKLKEYNEKVESMKKIKAEDLRLEKIQKENEKARIAKERAQKKIERTLSKLQNLVFKFGHFANVVGYNESQSILKLAIPRTYHRVINKRGDIIKTAPFIEISKTIDAFYCYNYKLCIFR